ncbi:MAG: hypothetical protein J7J29_03865 [Psychrobacter sp.]|jgi:hypothetical protein|uniref:hypothetical protein n=1 Tax=Psychrobacter TaxID=497 RepID=UPI000ECF7BD1|nr:MULTISPECIES: hypothetical protein [Psychrobacter]MCD6251438.1 hypothetical protein [Psychrobacter sp.]HCN17968.1 hypothetical protein [Psychrobacter sp.]
MRKTVLNTALSTAFIVALGVSVSACGGENEHDSHEVLAKDRVDEAAALAIKNAPPAEDIDFPETAPMPAAEADAAATAETATTEAETTGADMSETAATDSAGAAGAGSDSAETAATSSAAPQ